MVVFQNWARWPSSDRLCWSKRGRKNREGLRVVHYIAPASHNNLPAPSDALCLTLKSFLLLCFSLGIYIYKEIEQKKATQEVFTDSRIFFIYFIE